MPQIPIPPKRLYKFGAFKTCLWWKSSYEPPWPGYAVTEEWQARIVSSAVTGEWHTRNHIICSNRSATSYLFPVSPFFNTNFLPSDRFALWARDPCHTDKRYGPDKVPINFRTRKATAKFRTLWLQSCFIQISQVSNFGRVVALDQHVLTKTSLRHKIYRQQNVSRVKCARDFSTLHVLDSPLSRPATRDFRPLIGRARPGDRSACWRLCCCLDHLRSKIVLLTARP